MYSLTLLVGISVPSEGICVVVLYLIIYTQQERSKIYSIFFCQYSPIRHKNKTVLA